MTHTEACALVENVLERAIKTLAYIRLNSHRYSSDAIKNSAESADLLCNIHWYGAYLLGARTMLLKLRDNELCKEPNKEAIRDKDEKIYSKAILDLLMSDTLNTETFLSHNYDEIRFTDHERNKKGKLLKCRAYFAKRVVEYKEV